jgi:4-amino-4-deoxy-L-arabinose transferase-like glycosyltransferase
MLGLAATLLFVGLGRDYLWADEGDTAVLAKSILKFGVPTAWDGVSFIDADFGARLNDSLVMVSHPWLQYYVTAVSFALFGEAVWAARLPFALSGLATMALVYATVFRATRNRWTAATGAALLMLSVQFLLYARQSRHYTLNAALTCLLVVQFARLNSWTNSLLFAGIGILLFHSHPIAIAPMVALGVLTIVYRPFHERRRWFWRAFPIWALFTLPWLVIARGGYAQNTGLIQDAGILLPRLGQFAIECASVTSVIGAAVLFLVVRRRGRAVIPAAGRGRTLVRRPPVFSPDERGLLVALVAIMATYAVVMAVTQSRDTIWSVGLRYTPAVIPFMAMIAALLIARASRGQWRPWVALVLVFGFTKLGRLTPWTFWEVPRPKRDPAAQITFHNPERTADRIFRRGQIAFVRSLVEQNPGTTARIIQYLNTHASPQDIVVTNYEWEPLYFHTGLRLGMTVLPSYPIYAAAKGHDLPDYVFRGDTARWIIWRQAWGSYRGQRLDQLVADLRTARVPISLAATIPETLAENSENIHFRRFAGRGHIFPWFTGIPETLIYRVDHPVARNGGNE